VRHDLRTSIKYVTPAQAEVSHILIDVVLSPLVRVFGIPILIEKSRIANLPVGRQGGQERQAR